MRNASIFMAAAALLVLGGSAASANQELRMLRDSLASVRDATELRSLEKHRARGGRGTNALVEQGFISLRLFDLTGDRRALSRARKAFEAAVRSAPANAWAQYGLGSTLARTPEARPVEAGGSRGTFVIDDVARRLMGRDVPARATAALSAATRAEPAIPNAAAELADLALMNRDRDGIETAHAALQQLCETGVASAADWLALSRIEAARNELPDAVRAADLALAAGADRSLAQHRRAVALLRTPGREADGARAYFDGLNALSPASAASYWADVTGIATDREQQAWAAGDHAVRKDLLARFWDVRAALGGLHTPDRLAEHYRRLAIAESRYPRISRFGAPAPNEFRWIPAQHRSRFDDRGEIFLRHGEPADIVRAVSATGGNETWIYVLPDGSTRIFPFVLTRGNYTLPYTIPCDEVDLLRNLSAYDSRLGVFSIRCDALSVASHSATMREAFHRALESDSDYIDFIRELPFLYDLYTFRGTDERTTVVAAFAVPARSINAIEKDGSVFYRLDVSLILADTAVGSVSRTDDSTRIARRERLRSSDMLRTHIEVEMPPSQSTLQRVIVSDPSEPGVGQLYHGPFRIPDYTGHGLMLSDIALAEPSPTGHWKRGAVTLSLVPTNEFRGGSFNVFYEIYNLPAGATYTTEVYIERVRRNAGDKVRNLLGRSDGEIRFRFAGESAADPSGVVQELRRVDAELGPGEYRLTVTVRNMESGEQAESTRRFVIPR